MTINLKNNFFHQHAFYCGVNKDFDFTIPFIKIKAFKYTGKWYSTQYSHLKKNHIKLIESHHGFKLLDLIRNKDEEVKKYCPLSNWDNSCHYSIETYGVDGFCTYLILAEE